MGPQVGANELQWLSLTLNLLPSTLAKVLTGPMCGDYRMTMCINGGPVRWGSTHSAIDVGIVDGITESNRECDVVASAKIP